MHNTNRDLTGNYSLVIEAVCRSSVALQQKRLRLRAVLSRLQSDAAEANAARAQTQIHLNSRVLGDRTSD